MSLTISFELNDADIEHFRRVGRAARDAVMQSGIGTEGILASARKKFSHADPARLPAYISTRLHTLATLVDMVEDSDWQLPEDELNHIVSAIAYFIDPDDLIPDRVPGIGFLDDAIMVELVIDELESEIAAYDEFCAYRSAERKRRAAQGLDTDIDRDDWLRDKRAVLHQRMRKLSAERISAPIRGIRLF